MISTGIKQKKNEKKKTKTRTLLSEAPSEGMREVSEDAV